MGSAHGFEHLQVPTAPRQRPGWAFTWIAPPESANEMLPVQEPRLTGTPGLTGEAAAGAARAAAAVLELRWKRMSASLPPFSGFFQTCAVGHAYFVEGHLSVMNKRQWCRTCSPAASLTGLIGCASAS